MDKLAKIIDWILRIVGGISIVVTILNLFLKDYEYSENVKLISQPDEEELNKCKSYQEYPNDPSAIEKTLFVPLSCRVKTLKLYEVEFKNNKIRKAKLVKKFENLEPYQGVLFNVSRGCAMPQYMLEWKIDYGYIGSSILYCNGFNGNQNEIIVKYNHSVFSKIRKFLSLK